MNTADKYTYNGLSPYALQAIVGDYGDHLDERVLWKYTEFLHGARAMAKMLIETEAVDFATGVKKNDGHDAYQEAMERFLLGDLGNVHHYLSGKEIRFADHRQGKDGRLESVRAIAVRPRVTYEEI